jgi:GT2 family glycosyltransferase
MHSKYVVSICLPCLNTFPFLNECLQSLNQQALSWELIACDGFSVDGSWELLQGFCDGFPNRSCFQSSAPLYDAWNLCITRASGSYIYIATSDDALAPGSLQLMVDALDANPDMALCQIRLKIFDSNSNLLPAERQWENGRLSFYHPGFTSKRHIRYAPHDGVLMAGFHTVYESINQLLIKRTVFDQVGYFDQRFGTTADFEWGMRVGLTQNCLYLPEAVAYWRQHPAQLTQPAFTASERLHALAMTRSAFRRASQIKPSLSPLLLLAMEDLLYDDYISALMNASSFSILSFFRLRATFILSETLARPRLLLRRLIRTLRGTSTTTFDFPRKRERMLSIMRRHGIELPHFTN